MRLVEVSAFRARIPLRRTIRHASHTRTESESLVVRCRLDDGAIGWGEGLPRPYVTGETADDAWQLWRDGPWREGVPRSWSSLSELVAGLDHLRVADPAPGRRDCFGHALRCAIELAVLDAAFRSAGRPLMDLVDFVPETLSIRCRTPRVRYGAAVTPQSGWREWIRAYKLWVWNFHQIKVKVGVAGCDDATTLRRLRTLCGERVDLRADANEAWTCATLEARLAPLASFGLTALEQPVPHAEVDGLADLRRSLGVPIMLDESLCSLTDGHRAVERGTCDLFNIRLSKCGGPIPSLKLAALAHRAGLASQLGCQVGETGILSAAGRHFACSVAGLRYLEGSFDRYLVRERLTREDLTFKHGGWAHAINAPGLGVDIDPAALRRVTFAEDHWPAR
jgi:muconate cycloisomerase